jgi:hypothetical protein
MTNEIRCKNCKHLIVKRKGLWKHKFGGTYCQMRYTFDNKPILGGCLCNNAVPMDEKWMY